TASSILRATSLSTTSGEAPGYSAVTTTTGKSISGNWSTCSRWYENSPSTTMASITMVANTGFFRLTRVNHMPDQGLGVLLPLPPAGEGWGEGCTPVNFTIVPSRSPPTY